MLYSYRAVDQSGKPLTGEREAGSERELADQLRRENLIMLEAAPRGAAARRGRWWERVARAGERVSLVERMVFARNLAVMIGAGLSLARALEALAAQSANRTFQRLLTDVREGVVKGRSFAESLRPYEKTFGTIFVNMVEAGEISGNLERVLKILAIQMKRDHDLRTRVRGAMLYPAVVVGALVLVGLLMMVYVVPILTQTLQELETELPITTRIIIGISDFLRSASWYALGIAVLLAAGVVRALGTTSGRRIFDTAMLRAPIIGAITKKVQAARFARTLASLLSSGIPITRALDVTASVLSNQRFRDALSVAAQAIQQGRALHDILAERHDLFPPMVTQMLQVGEETGTVNRMLLRLALFYEEEVTAVTKNLASIIEPALMIVIGAAVGLFALSMIQPIYSGLGNL